MKSTIDWQTHITQWESSGLSKAEYCRQHNLKLGTFYQIVSEHRKKSISNSLVEIPFPPSFADQKSQTEPVFEFYFTLPFRLRFKINIDWGANK